MDETIEWRVEASLLPYPLALETMEARVAAIRDAGARELVWLVEHPPLYTAGTSAVPEELMPDARFPVHAAGRGGRYTYHGPGQRVGYLMLDLRKRGQDVRAFVHALENWVIAALGRLGVTARAIDGRVGIWVDLPSGQAAKIGAIGVRVRRWVTLHGFSVNVAPDLSHFSGIVPCGLPDPVTSLADLGLDVAMETLDLALADEFPAFLEALSAVQHGP